MGFLLLSFHLQYWNVMAPSKYPILLHTESLVKTQLMSTVHTSHRKNIFCSMNEEKIREERIFEIAYCPFQGRAKVQHLCQLNGPVSQCQLGGNLKGQCTISKILFPLILSSFIEQNIFFTETCFACTSSEQKFTV